MWATAARPTRTEWSSWTPAECTYPRALRRFRDATREERLLNHRGLPAFDVRFCVLDRKGEKGEHAGMAAYGAGESRFAVCDEDGSRLEPLEGLLEGAP